MCIINRLFKRSLGGRYLESHMGLVVWLPFYVGRGRPLTSRKALHPWTLPSLSQFRLVRAGDCVFKIRDLFERQ